MSTPHKTFLCDYPFNGRRWAFTIRATDQDEAEERLRALGWARVGGECVAALPGWLPAWIAAFICWWRNRE